MDNKSVDEIISNTQPRTIASSGDRKLIGKIYPHDEEGFFRLYTTESQLSYYVVSTLDLIEDPELVDSNSALRKNFISGDVYSVSIASNATIYKVSIEVVPLQNSGELANMVEAIDSEDEMSIEKEDKCPARA